MYDLRDFGLSEMMLVGAALRGAGKGSASLEQASQRVARYFVEEFVDGATGRSSFVLARCYKTHPFAGLPADLQQFARGVFPDQPLEPRTQCLTLLGSFGDDPAWQSRRGSSGHQTIPLTSERTVESLPMVARLTQAMGLAASELIRPDPSFLLEKDRQGFNVFHIEEALGSPYIPAQETFVRPNGVRSVIGFGVLVPPTHVYTTILFSRQHISAPTADLFKTLALSLKLALLPISTGPVFDHVES